MFSTFGVGRARESLSRHIATFACFASLVGPPMSVIGAPPGTAPPLKLFGIPARYANATYTAASKQGVLEKVETELLGFKQVRGIHGEPCQEHAAAGRRFRCVRDLGAWVGVGRSQEVKQ